MLSTEDNSISIIYSHMLSAEDSSVSIIFSIEDSRARHICCLHTEDSRIIIIFLLKIAMQDTYAAY